MASEDQYTKDQIQNLKEKFKLFDKDSDGFISQRELRGVLRSLGQKPTEAELRAMLDEIETDSSGLIGFPDFLAMMERKNKTSDTQEKEIREVFEIIDNDKNGFISYEELRVALLNMNEDLSVERVDDMVREADRDGDGQINFEEFMAMLMGK